MPIKIEKRARTFFASGKNFHQFSLLTWTSFIGQFDYPVGRGGVLSGWKGGN